MDVSRFFRRLRPGIIALRFANSCAPCRMIGQYVTCRKEI